MSGNEQCTIFFSCLRTIVPYFFSHSGLTLVDTSPLNTYTRSRTCPDQIFIVGLPRLRWTPLYSLYYPWPHPDQLQRRSGLLSLDVMAERLTALFFSHVRLLFSSFLVKHDQTWSVRTVTTSTLYTLALPAGRSFLYPRVLEFPSGEWLYYVPMFYAPMLT